MLELNKPWDKITASGLPAFQTRSDMPEETLWETVKRERRERHKRFLGSQSVEFLGKWKFRPETVMRGDKLTLKRKGEQNEPNLLD